MQAGTLQGGTELFYDGVGGLRNGIQCDKVLALPIGLEVFIPRQHTTLVYLVLKATVTGKIARWTLLLQEFEFDIYH